MKTKKDKVELEEFCNDIIRRLSQNNELGLCDVKRMFGGYGVSLGDYFFGIVTNLGNGPEFYLKVNKETEPIFIAKGSHKFKYRKNEKEASIGYYSMPEEGYDNSKVFNYFSSLGLESSMSK